MTAARFATVAFYDDVAGEWFDAKVLDIFPLRQTRTDQSGFVVFDAARVDLDNADGNLRQTLNAWIGATVTLIHRAETEYSDGTEYAARDRRQTMRVTEAELTPGRVRLTCAALERSALAALYPPLTWAPEDWPDIYPSHAGSVMPEVSGAAPMTCVFLGEFGTGTARRWRYGVCRVRAGQIITGNIIARAQQTVAVWDDTAQAYLDRNGQTLAEAAIIPVGDNQVYVIDFVLDQAQRGGGSPHRISCAVITADADRNAAAEVERLLLFSGAAVDSQSFATAAAYCAANHLLIDYAYRDRRRVDALLAELLVVSRGTLTVDSAGAFVMVQDRAVDLSGVAVYAQPDDPVAVERMTVSATPSEVSIQYSPRFLQPNYDADNRPTHNHSVSRAIVGGTSPPARLRDFDMVRDFETADRVIDYMAANTAASIRATARIEAPPDRFYQVGDVIGIGDNAVYSRARYWVIEQVSTAGLEQQLTLRPYTAAAHTYSPGPAPRETLTELSTAIIETAAYFRITVSTGGILLGDGQGNAAQIPLFDTFDASFGKVFADPLGQYVDIWEAAAYEFQWNAQAEPSAAVGDGLYFQLQRNGVWVGESVGPYTTYESGNKQAPITLPLFWALTELDQTDKGRYTLWGWRDGGTTSVAFTFGHGIVRTIA